MVTKYPRIAVVDDEKSQREILEMILKSEGYHNLTFHPSGQNFLEFYSNHDNAPPDIVLLDTQMVGMTGFEVLEKALQSETFSQTMFIMNSAYFGEERDKRWAIHIGFEDILQNRMSVKIC